MTLEPLHDRFTEDLLPGKVVGSHTPTGQNRLGIDLEQVMGIDGGALRIQPLCRPGWGRVGLAYGPFQRQNGLAFGAFLLNGHHSAQTGGLMEPLRDRLARWLRASGTDPLWWRALHAPIRARKRLLRRQFQRWHHLSRTYGEGRGTPINENLAVGWFPEEIPTDASRSGHALVVHATGEENGALWARGHRQTLPLIDGLQNLPAHLIIVLRHRGAAYYAASLPGARGLPTHPFMRPLAIDPEGDTARVFAGIHPSVMGQIGFRVDTRVYHTAVALLPTFRAWYGSAHAADHLTGTGPLEGRQLEVGGPWTLVSGRLERTEWGLQGGRADNRAILEGPAPAGLAHLVIEITADHRGTLTLLWRHRDEGHHWRWQLDRHGQRLMRLLGGEPCLIAEADTPPALEGVHSLQIHDDGHTMAFFCDGRKVFGRGVEDPALGEARGFGLGLHTDDTGAPSGLFLRDLEVHPRILPIPPELGFGDPKEVVGTGPHWGACGGPDQSGAPRVPSSAPTSQAAPTPPTAPTRPVTPTSQAASTPPVTPTSKVAPTPPVTPTSQAVPTPPVTPTSQAVPTPPTASTPPTAPTSSILQASPATRPQPLLADDFFGAPGPLEGRTTPLGEQCWQKTLGPGRLLTSRNGFAKVDASLLEPNPGRTLYTLPWPHPSETHLEVKITPPGTARGEGHAGRSGLVLWQDPENYLIVNIWLADAYGGASISSFFHIHGFEDIYDAVWTNVGTRVCWGEPCRLALASDGRCFTAFVHQEPVLFRAFSDVYPDLSRLAIHRVGLAVNWEWGQDTGSVFRHFVASRWSQQPLESP